MSKKLKACTILGKRKIDPLDLGKNKIIKILKSPATLSNSSIIRVIPHKKLSSLQNVNKNITYVLQSPSPPKPISGFKTIACKRALAPSPIIAQMSKEEILDDDLEEEFQEYHDITETNEENCEEKQHSENCCSTCKDTLDLILQQQNEILNLLKNYKPQKKLDLLPAMPFDDLNDFLDFDESLNTHDNVADQFIYKLKKLLVSTEQKSIINIMAHILTNELSRKISWVGIKDTQAFASTNMVHMIVDVVQEHHQVDMDVIKSRIGDWLRRCGDRINSELRRKKKKEEEGYAV